MVYLCADVVHTYVVVIFCLMVQTCVVDIFFKNKFFLIQNLNIKMDILTNSY